MAVKRAPAERDGTGNGRRGGRVRRLGPAPRILAISAPVGVSVLGGVAVGVSVGIPESAGWTALWLVVSSVVYRAVRPARLYLGLTAAILLGLTVLWAILLPVEAYRIWLDLRLSGTPGGTVSGIVLAIYTVAVTPLSWSRRPWYAIAGTTLLIAVLDAGLGGGPVSVAVGAGVLLAIVLSRLVVRMNQGRARGLATAMGASLLVGAAAVIIPIPQVSRGISFVDSAVAPWARETVLRIFPAAPVLARVPGYESDLSTGSGRLGEPPLLTEHPVFEVRTNSGRTVYLRTSVYREYGDGGWARVAADPEAVYTWESSPDDLSLAKENNERASGTGPDVVLQVLVDYSTRVPVTPNTVIAEVAGRGRTVVGDPTVRTDRALPQGTTINLYEQAVPGGASSEPRGGPVETAQDGTNRGDARPGDSSARELEQYLQLPPPIKEDPALRVLADRFRGRSPLEDVRAIASWFTAEFKYTLQTEPPPEGSDFVRAFLLENREGFCTHFASAAVILLRLNGRPARLATGFYARTDSDGRATVLGKNAHAWPEIWTATAGWTQVEVTPPAVGEGTAWSGQSQYAVDQETRGQLLHTFGISVPEDSALPTGADDRWLRDSLVSRGIGYLAAQWPWSAVTLGTALLAAVSVVAAGRRAGEQRRLTVALRRAVKAAERRGFPRPEEVGWVRWFDGVARVPSPEAGSELRDQVLRRLYGWREDPRYAGSAAPGLRHAVLNEEARYGGNAVGAAERPPPELLRLLRALRKEKTKTGRYHGMRARPNSG